MYNFLSNHLLHCSIIYYNSTGSFSTVKKGQHTPRMTVGWFMWKPASINKRQINGKFHLVTPQKRVHIYFVQKQTVSATDNNKLWQNESFPHCLYKYTVTLTNYGSICVWQTNPMDHGTSWYDKSSSANRNIPRILCNQTIYPIFLNSCHLFPSSAKSIRSTCIESD